MACGMRSPRTSVTQFAASLSRRFIIEGLTCRCAATRSTTSRSRTGHPRAAPTRRASSIPPAPRCRATATYGPMWHSGSYSGLSDARAAAMRRRMRFQLMLRAASSVTIASTEGVVMTVASGSVGPKPNLVASRCHVNPGRSQPGEPGAPARQCCAADRSLRPRLPVHLLDKGGELPLHDAPAYLERGGELAALDGQRHGQHPKQPDLLVVGQLGVGRLHRLAEQRLHPGIGGGADGLLLRDPLSSGPAPQSGEVGGEEGHDIRPAVANEHRGVHEPGALEQLLDGLRGDVLAACGDDEVLLAVRDVEA